MITAKAFAGKHYAVLGLARSGLATVEALLASGAKVTAWDSDPKRVESLRLSRAKPRDVGEGVSTSLDTNGLGFANLDEVDLTQFDSIVVTPGLPLNRHPIAARSKAAGVEIIGDIELFARARPELPPHKVVGITGTNGKSTTTALVHHILKTAGVPSLMGGNIGLPILSQDPLPEGGVYVLELSSYQIDLTKTLDCDVAVLLNITPDHLDRYDGFEDYAKSKVRLLTMQHNENTTLVGFHPSVQNAIGSYLQFGSPLQWPSHLDPEPIFKYYLPQSEMPSLQGPHNAENVAAAVNAVGALRLIPTGKIYEALRTYPGLPHRMERIREIDGVLFINDSKATNAEAAAPALAAYPRVRWIVGGQAKGKTLGQTADHLDHVAAAYTIGEAGPMFARLLRAAGVTVIECETLENAVKRAAEDSQAGETVLLSPASASFDQFRDFEARGDRFREYVGAL